MVRCPMCEGSAAPVREEREIRLGRRRTRVVHEFYRCETCGEEFFLPGQMDAVLRRAADRIRKEEGLLGRAPQAVAFRTSRLCNEQWHERGRVEVADHPLCCETKSLTVRFAAIGFRGRRLARRAGLTCPSMII